MQKSGHPSQIIDDTVGDATDVSQFPWTHGGRTRNSLHVDMHPPPEVSGGRRR